MMCPTDPVVGVRLNGPDIRVFEDLFTEFDDVGVVLFRVKVLGEDESRGGEMLGEFVGFLGVGHGFSIEIGEGFDVDSLKCCIEIVHCQKNICGCAVWFLPY